MKGLTAKEEEIMGFFWEKGPLFVKEMLAFYEEPKPHFNTLSTIVRGLEDKGFLSHKVYGNTYQYYAVVDKEDFSKKTLKGVICKYFNNSYLSAVSSLVKEEDISLDELKQLIAEVEKVQNKSGNRYGNFLCLYTEIISLPGGVLSVLPPVVEPRNVSSFQPDGVAGHTVALVPFAAGGGDCGEADGGASDDDELGAMAYAGGRAGCGNCFR